MSDRAFERITRAMESVSHNATLELSPVQLRILQRMSNGARHAEIEAELGIAYETLREYQKQIYRTLGARNASHAVAIGFRSGILE